MNFLSRRWRIDRRDFLRGSGVALSLPWLEAMSPASKSIASAGEAAPGEIPKRALFAFWGLGLNGRDYTPTAAGRDYEATPILKPIDKHRDDYTVLTGLKLNYSGGHGGDRTFLTGNCTHKADSKLHVSVDQQLAEHLGNVTRFKSLVLGIQRGTGFGNAQDNTLSWSPSGTPLPAENRPDVLFDQLFRKETPEQLAQREQGYKLRASILDSVGDSAARLKDRVGADDRRKLDEYFTSIREIERRMAGEKEWLHREKPQVDREGGVPKIEPPTSKTSDYRTYQRLMYDVITLALQTDSTRVISYMARKDLGDGTGSYGFLGNPYDYHTLTHHGEDPERLKWLTQVDIWHMEDWCYFLDKLRSVREGTGTLLDYLLLARGSSGGTVNAHNNTMLPTILHGGSRIGVKHQGHLIVSEKSLGNLWRTMIHWMGMPLPDQFMGGESDGRIEALT